MGRVTGDEDEVNFIDRPDAAHIRATDVEKKT